ncbi:hypothetical protein KIW84_011194 [Lathyrus oleraceus]|uniref:Retroviral polymerase SH3-like domain-containing protein n=1 Tax=Pisum sativum TaxID=3888 RepID=A0A9D4YM27_PEA|nr:hypothetical protein KIW84_011194 [Pisum sativum]
MHALKVSGSLTYAATLQSQITKLDPWGRKCIFLGFKQGTEGVILLDPNNHDIFMSRNITHHEHIFPFNPNWKYYPSHQPANNQNGTPHYTTSIPLTIEHDSDLSFDTSPYTDIPCEEQNHNTQLIEPNIIPYTVGSTDTVPHPDSSIKTSRSRHPHAHLKDYVCNTSSNQCIHSSSVNSVSFGLISTSLVMLVASLQLSLFAHAHSRLDNKHVALASRYVTALHGLEVIMSSASCALGSWLLQDACHIESKTKPKCVPLSKWPMFGGFMQNGFWSYRVLLHRQCAWRLCSNSMFSLATSFLANRQLGFYSL